MRKEGIGFENKNEQLMKLPFPAVCWDLTSLVALSTQTIRHPVTAGSKVPEWPVFSTFKIFLIQVTTSWEDGFGGLSKLTIEYLDR